MMLKSFIKSVCLFVCFKTCYRFDSGFRPVFVRNLEKALPNLLAVIWWPTLSGSSTNSSQYSSHGTPPHPFLRTEPWQNQVILRWRWACLRPLRATDCRRWSGGAKAGFASALRISVPTTCHLLQPAMEAMEEGLERYEGVNKLLLLLRRGISVD